MHKRLEIFIEKINKKLNIKEAFESIIDCAYDIFPEACCCTLWLNDYQKNKLLLISHKRNPAVKGARYFVDCVQHPSVKKSKVFKEHKIVVSDSLQDYVDPIFEHFHCESCPQKTQLESQMCIPMWRDNYVLALLNVCSMNKSAFSADKIGSYELFAKLSAFAIDNARRNTERLILEDILDVISKPYTINAAFGEIINIIKKYIKTDYCSIFIYDKTINEMYCIASTGLYDIKGQLIDESCYNNCRYKIGEGLTGYVAKELVTLRIFNCYDTQELISIDRNLSMKAKFREVLITQGMWCHFLGFPLVKEKMKKSTGKTQKRLYGIVRLIKEGEGPGFFNCEELILDSITSELALLIENYFLEQADQKKKKNLKAMLSTAIAINLEFDMSEILGILLEESLKLLETNIGIIFDVEQENGVLIPLCSKGIELNELANISLGEEKLIADLKQTVMHSVDKNFHSCMPFDSNFKSHFAIPLNYKNNTLGVIVICFQEHRILSTDEHEILSYFANQAAAIIVREEFLWERHEFETKLLRDSTLLNLGEVAGEISHEVGNMLHKISSVNTFLSRNKAIKNNTELIEHLVDLDYRIKECSNIIRNVKGMYRSKAKDTVFNINELVEESLTLYKQHKDYKEKRIVVKKELSREVDNLPYTGYKIRILQSINNILLNAIQAVSRKGKIFISTGIANMSIQNKVKKEIYIKIADNGCGIAVNGGPKVYQ